MPTERTLVLAKPDAVQRGLVGEVISRFERRGLHPVGVKLMQVTTAMAENHYAEHRGKPFFAGLVEFITSSPVVAMVWEGPGAIALVRTMMGATDPQTSPPGTIRGDLAVSLAMNVIHGSDSPPSAAREIGIFFDETELLDWHSSAAGWIVAAD
jgi:nucleoside-diphosphate kinase